MHCVNYEQRWVEWTECSKEETTSCWLFKFLSFYAAMSQTEFLHSVSVIRIQMKLIQILPLLWSFTELWSLVKDLGFFMRFPCMYCLPYAVSMPNNRPIHHLLTMMLLKHLFSHKLSVRLTERKISQYISCPCLQIKRLVFADSWRICGEIYLRLCHLLFIICHELDKYPYIKLYELQSIASVTVVHVYTREWCSNGWCRT